MFDRFLSWLVEKVVPHAEKWPLLRARDLIRRSGSVDEETIRRVDALIAAGEYLNASLLLQELDENLELAGDPVPGLWEILAEVRSHFIASEETSNAEVFAGKHLDRYRNLLASGVSPKELSAKMKAEGLNRLERVTYLRAVFELDLKSAVDIDCENGPSCQTYFDAKQGTD